MPWPLTGNLPEPKAKPLLSLRTRGSHYNPEPAGDAQLRVWREAMGDPEREPQPAPYLLMDPAEAQAVMRALGRKTLPITLKP